MIIRNAIRCRRCKDEIESKHRHDFKSCTCGGVYVDGGRAYLKRGFGGLGGADYDELSTVSDDDINANVEGVQAVRQPALRPS